MVTTPPSQGTGPPASPKFFGTPTYAQIVWPGARKFDVWSSLFQGGQPHLHHMGVGPERPPNFLDTYLFQNGLT